MAESKLGIPPEGPERGATRSAMGEGAAASDVLASLLMIDPDHPGERRFPNALARQPGLYAALVAELEAQARGA